MKPCYWETVVLPTQQPHLAVSQLYLASYTFLQANCHMFFDQQFVWSVVFLAMSLRFVHAGKANKV